MGSEMCIRDSLGLVGLVLRKLKTVHQRRTVGSAVDLLVGRATLGIQDFVKLKSSCGRCTGCNNSCRVQGCDDGSHHYNPAPTIVKGGGGSTSFVLGMAV